MITLKKAVTESDWHDVKIMLHELLLFEKSIRPQRKERKITDSGPIDYVRENIRNNNGFCFIAMDDDQPVGFISGWIEDGDGLDIGDNRFGKICDCYVCPAYRGRHVFKLLLQAMVAYFKAVQIIRLSVDTLGTHRKMQLFLSRFGFKIHRLIYEMSI